ncbi:MAG: aspartate--ammonia ligase [Sarcina sp.]
MNINKKVFIPTNYNSSLSLKDTAIAIKRVKDFFETALSYELSLTRISAPLFVAKSTGLNDNLNGTEKPVSFNVKSIENESIEIVHSLAKWKRNALKRYNFNIGEGLYTDMNAIRSDENLDNLHSIYVDQWDWEKIIKKEDRTEETLRIVVNKIFNVFKKTEEYVESLYPNIKKQLPEEIFFISSQELYNKYPTLSSKERENEICREKKAVFISNIGYPLSNNEKHDGRSPDYDDWNLNGDILFYYPLFDSAIELSSMGIRVDETALLKQLSFANELKKTSLPFHNDLLKGNLPYTIGGGIGQSRICMYFLQKAHIGEVQASLWDNETVNICCQNNINLL